MIIIPLVLHNFLLSYIAGMFQFYWASNSLQVNYIWKQCTQYSVF